MPHEHASENKEGSTVALEAYKETEGENWVTVAWLSTRPGAGLFICKDKVVYDTCTLREKVRVRMEK